MATPNSEHIGEAVFGTALGLKARGTGVLQGIDLEKEALDFRDNDSHESLMPTGENYLIFRQLGTYGKREIDLIGIIIPMRDLRERPGLFGYAVAVDRGNAAAYRSAYVACPH